MTTPVEFEWKFAIINGRHRRLLDDNRYYIGFRVRIRPIGDVSWIPLAKNGCVILRPGYSYETSTIEAVERFSIMRFLRRMFGKRESRVEPEEEDEEDCDSIFYRPTLSQIRENLVFKS